MPAASQPKSASSYLAESLQIDATLMSGQREISMMMQLAVLSAGAALVQAQLLLTQAKCKQQAGSEVTASNASQHDSALAPTKFL